VTPGNKTKAPKAARNHTASAKAHPAAAQNIAGEHAASKLTVLTIGHSTRTIEEFLAILAAHGVERLIDVRSIPKSRRVPQFNSDALAPSLREQEIEYMHMKSLGGLRRAKKDSVNLGWHNASFRGYADLHGHERESLRRNAKRGIGFDEAREIFFHPYYADQRSDPPVQHRAIGWVRGRLYSVIYEIREDAEGEFYDLVTLWKATSAERKLYEEHTTQEQAGLGRKHRADGGQRQGCFALFHQLRRDEETHPTGERGFYGLHAGRTRERRQRSQRQQAGGHQDIDSPGTGPAPERASFSRQGETLLNFKLSGPAS